MLQCPRPPLVSADNFGARGQEVSSTRSQSYSAVRAGETTTGICDAVSKNGLREMTCQRPSPTFGSKDVVLVIVTP